MRFLVCYIVDGGRGYDHTDCRKKKKKGDSYKVTPFGLLLNINKHWKERRSQEFWKVKCLKESHTLPGSLSKLTVTAPSSDFYSFFMRRCLTSLANSSLCQVKECVCMKAGRFTQMTDRFICSSSPRQDTKDYLNVKSPEVVIIIESSWGECPKHITANQTEEY